MSPYSVRMRENTDQNNFEYEHFLRSVYLEYSYKEFSLRFLGVYLQKINNNF